jgi:hypothetical protein
MPSKKVPASKKAAVSKSAAKKAPAAKKPVESAAASTFRLKVDLANVAVGAKTIKQLSRAVGKLAQTLTKMEDAGGVSLEAPVTGKAVNLVTQDAKLARRFGMEEGRAPRGAKTAAPAKKAAAKKAAAKKTRTQAADAAPAVEAADTAAPAVKKRAAKKASAKKAPAKKAARKTQPANGSNEPARAADGASAAAPEAPPATDTPGAEAAAS